MTRRGRGDCAHCDAGGVPVYRFGAPLCGRCRHAAATRIGHCPGCAKRRLLPGRLDGEFVCAACAGITVGCRTCDHPDRPLFNTTTCVPCANRPMLIEALCAGVDPGPAGRDLLDAIGMSARWRLRRWLATDDDLIPVVRGALAAGAPITHDVLDQLAPNRRVEHLRRRLILTSALPDRDHQLLLFDRWLSNFLPTIIDNRHRQTVSAYATWHHRRRIAAQVDAGTLRSSAPRAARRHIRAAARFLESSPDDNARSQTAGKPTSTTGCPTDPRHSAA